jgi:hypothetical protein
MGVQWGVKTVSLLATGVVAVAVLAACSTSGRPGGQPAPARTGPASPSASRSASAPPRGPGQSPGPGRTPPQGGDPGRTASPGVDPENPNDRVGAPMTVAGVVASVGGCVVLDAGARRWALTGEPAARLRQGARVTVRGWARPVPAGCSADGGLEVILVS